MVFFNYATMQMAAKIVYYGPGLCGKTTNLQHVYNKTSPQSRGEMVSLETETDRTLFFDLLPIDVGVIGGFKTRLQLYTVPGQVFYNSTRKLVLKGADGIVFVADSQEPMLDANVQSMKNLKANLGELSLDLDEIPLVIQLNKRDLPNVVSREVLESRLNPDGKWPVIESSAVKGEGVFETLKLISKLTLKTLRTRMTGEEEAPQRSTFRVQSSPSTASGSTPLPLADTDDDVLDPKRTVSAPNPLAGTAPEHAAETGTATGVLEHDQDSGHPGDGDEVPVPPGLPDEPTPPAQFPYPGAQEQSSSVSPEQGETEPPQIETQESASAADSSTATPQSEDSVKRVKVRSTVDIMAELEVLRRNATGKSKGDDEKPSTRRDLHKSIQMQVDHSHRDQLKDVTITVELKDGEGNALDSETKTWSLTAEEFRKLIVNLNVDLG
ncbi:MAG: hypothetical protein KY432_01475 [Acidobacteria bacterium]|nr:hypothetical protein [Acidobacteriota bacterium]